MPRSFCLRCTNENATLHLAVGLVCLITSDLRADLIEGSASANFYIPALGIYDVDETMLTSGKYLAEASVAGGQLGGDEYVRWIYSGVAYSTVSVNDPFSGSRSINIRAYANSVVSAESPPGRNGIGPTFSVSAGGNAFFLSEAPAGSQFKMVYSRSGQGSINSSFGSGSPSSGSAVHVTDISGQYWIAIAMAATAGGYGVPSQTLAQETLAHGSVHWSLSGATPGTSPENAITAYYDYGVASAQNARKSLLPLTSYPVGLEDIGTQTYLYTRIAATNMATDSASTNTFDALDDDLFSMELSASTNFAAVTIPLTSSNADDSYLVTFGDTSVLLSSGQEVNLLEYNATGFDTVIISRPESEFALPNFLDTAFKFTAPGDVVLYRAVPEANIVFLTALGVAWWASQRRFQKRSSNAS